MGDAEGRHAQYWYLMVWLVHSVTLIYTLCFELFLYSNSKAESHSTLFVELLLNSAWMRFIRIDVLFMV